MGKFSYYTQAGECQIMYHISTYLPYKPNDTQQIERKCHIGNDVVVIIWQDDPSCSFDPSSIASQFNTVFIVVRLEPNSDPLRPLYRFVFIIFLLLLLLLIFYIIFIKIFLFHFCTLLLILIIIFEFII